MTECERFIKEGLFTPDFFKPEVRCDFLVDDKRKRLWAVQLDLLFQLDRVCRKYGLSYHLLGGSLLGAVRHDGYIPWDDDLDVTMTRADYKVLLRHGDEFAFPYELEYSGCGSGYYYSFAKLRNARTTGISPVFAFQKMNHGIFLDIFPLDKSLAGEGSERYDRVRDLCIANSTYMRLTNPKLDERNRARVESYNGANPIETARAIDSICECYQDEDTPFYTTMCCSVYPWKKIQFPRWCYEKVILHEFEGFQLPVPVGWETLLKINFGDWKKFPPIENRNGGHCGIIFDPDVPYLEYVRKIKEGVE